MNVLIRIGQTVIHFLDSMGRLLAFIGTVLVAVVTPPYYTRLIGKQCISIGYFSLPVVGLTTLFTGMVLALQAYGGIDATFATQTIPPLVVLAMTRELSPVLSGLMVAGRIGSAIAAELGSMRVTEQIDALETLHVSAYKYLITPRVIGAVITLPLLVLVGDILGIFGGYLVSTNQLNISSHDYLINAYDAVQWIGVLSGVVKAAVFGFIIAIMGAYMGFFSKGGAAGVGEATIQSVVTSSILILVGNYVISLLFFGS